MKTFHVSNVVNTKCNLDAIRLEDSDSAKIRDSRFLNRDGPFKIQNSISGDSEILPK